MIAEQVIEPTNLVEWISAVNRECHIFGTGAGVAMFEMGKVPGGRFSFDAGSLSETGGDRREVVHGVFRQQQ